MFFLGLPLVLVVTVFVAAAEGLSPLWLVLSGVIAMPVYAMIPGVLDNAAPFSNPTEEAKSASNFPIMMLSMVGAFAIAGAATAASAMGLLAYFLILEAIVSACLCFGFQKLVARSRWRVFD
jgi:hypothetical protein